MHAFRSEDVDRSRDWRGRRWHKNSETPIFKFFNNKCGDEGFFNFGERRLPHVLLRTARQLMRQTPKESIAGESFKERFLDSFPYRATCRGAGRSTNKKTDDHHKQKREDRYTREPPGKQLRH